MRVLVCGSRYWSDREYLYEMLDVEHADNIITVLIEGEAPGADTMAREWAESRGIPVERYPANWKKFGKAAGPIRNKQMLDEGMPDYVIAFTPDISKSRGTANMVLQTVQAGIPVNIYNG